MPGITDPGESRRRTRVLALLAVAAFLLPLLPAPPGLAPVGDAAADAVLDTGARLPSARHGAAAVHHAGAVYVFGGRSAGDAALDHVVKFVPATGAVTTLASKLPSPRSHMGLAYDGTHVYLFGGRGQGTARLADVVSFHPETGTVATLVATLPWGLEQPAAAWTGTEAYLFGGLDAGGAARREIYRFTPSSGALVKINPFLPVARYGASAAWLGGAAYVAGGHKASYPNGNAVFTPTSDVIRFTPPSEFPRDAFTVLPFTAASAGSFTDGVSLYLLGGATDGGALSARMLRYHATEGPGTMAARLPAALQGAAVAWDGTRAYVIGGRAASEASAAILRYSLVPGAPLSPAAACGPGGGQITVTWGSPSLDTWRAAPGAITGYRVWAGTFSGSANLIATVNGSTFSHTDSDIPYGAARYYRVSALTPDGESLLSTEAMATARGLPEAPGGLAAHPGPDAGEVRVTWAEPAGGCDTVRGYRVYGSDSPGSLALLGEVAGRSFTDSGVPAGGSRHYRVAALNSVGEGPQSLTVEGKPPALPGAPINLATAAGPGKGEVTLSWAAPANNGPVARYAYRVYAVENGTLALVGEAPVGSSGIVDAGLPDGARRTYRVAAVNGVGEGPPSAAADGSAPARIPAVTGLRAIPYSRGTVLLDWDRPTDTGGVPLTGYRIHRWLGNATEPTSYDVGPGPSYQPRMNSPDAGLPDGTLVRYKVAALNAAGEGTAGPEVATATHRPPTAPGNLTAEADTANPGWTLVRWTPPADWGGSTDRGYTLWRRVNADAPVAVAFLTQNVHADRACTAGSVCFYRVTATTFGFESEPSNEAWAPGLRLVAGGPSPVSVLP